MVKLRYCAKCAKLLVLGFLLFLIWGAIWLQSEQRSLNYFKPLILRSINAEDASYTVSFSDVTIDWRNLAELGRLHITHLEFSKRDGPVFAQLPDIYATIDPLGFLPGRHVLNNVILKTPHLFITHTADNDYKLGLNEEDSPIALSELMPSTEAESSPRKKVRLPLRQVTLEHAVVNFYDEKTDTRLISPDLNLKVGKRSGRYEGVLAMPFTYEEKNGTVNAVLASVPGHDNYRLDVSIAQFPAKLICVLGFCPAKVTAEGTLNADARLGIAPNATLNTVWTHITTPSTVVTAPVYFEKPLKLTQSEVIGSYDTSARTATLTSAKFGLEDTNATLKGTGQQRADGWHIEAQGAASKLDITKLYKYWPLTMAHDSRLWVTSKMRSGYAAGGTVQLHITPADIAAGQLSDSSLVADVEARDMSVDYLHDFPEIEHLDGSVHFTGTTVRVNAANGSLLTGTTVSKATLWCPNLMNPRNPMESTLVTQMPMRDVVHLLDLDLFTFDDAAKLNEKTVKGTLNTTMAFKFFAFPDPKDRNPNAIHLDAIDYNIEAHIADFAQDNLFGGYDVKAITGDLTASTGVTIFNGVVKVGEAAASNVALERHDGKPLTLKVKAVAGDPLPSVNDFMLTYDHRTDMRRILLEGKGLDASASYGGSSENSVLKDFPAVHLDVKLGTLLLAPTLPFTEVGGTLHCTALRCESAHFSALQRDTKVVGDIGYDHGQRRLLITSSDAGGLLKGLAVTDRMKGGKLELRGTYDDTKNPPPFNGQISIYNFSLVNAQVLGRILSIGSLTGLANALTGSGIAFDKLIANLHVQEGVVTIADGRANGNALGITVKGVTDTNTGTLALKGVLSPAYAINSILGKIPLIGALAGGENEGLIAFNYAVHGTYEDPEVMVNPLSGLTPGFLRGIFKVFDQSPSDKPSDAKSVDSKPILDRNKTRP